MAGKCDSRCHSTTSFSESLVVVEITTIIITGVEVLLFLASSNKDNSANFSGEESTIKLSGVSIFFIIYAKKFKSNLVLVYSHSCPQI